MVTGQEFARPFKRLPAAWFVERVLLSMAKQVRSVEQAAGGAPVWTGGLEGERMTAGV